MNGKKIRTAKKGVEQAAENLGRDDKAAIVEFDTAASVVLNAVQGDSLSRIPDEVKGIEAEGKTNITDGLAKSRRVLRGMERETQHIDWIVLLSDGKPNKKNIDPFDVSGPADPDDADLHADVAAELGQEGITIHTAGIGKYDENILDQISTKSGGASERLGSAGKIEKFFQTQVTEAKNVVATNPVLELTPRNGASIDELVQKVPHVGEPTVEQHGERYVVHAADLNTDKPPEYTFKLTSPPQDKGVHTLVDVELTVDSDRTTGSIDVKFVPDNIRDEQAGENRVEVEHDNATGITKNKSDMNKKELDEETSRFVEKR